MSDQPSPVPTDQFSRVLRGMHDNPAALRAESTIHARDWYGNVETWNLQTYRHDGADVVLLQRVSAAGSDRIVLPAEITAALARHRDQLAARTRSRGARLAVLTKRQAGQAIGNPAALAKARRRKGKS